MGMLPNEKNPFSLLMKIWLVISTFTNIVALASITDGLIAWSDFVKEMIVSYAQIRDFLWGNLFAFINLSVPAWVHDYLTINSILAISILWAMIDGGKSISSSKLTSAFLYLKNSVLDFTVGAQVPTTFVREAQETLSAAGLPPDSEQSAQLSKLARPIVSLYTIMKSSFMAILVCVSYFFCAFVFPWVIQANDKWDANLAAFEFRRLEQQVRQIPWAPAQLDIVLKVLRRNVSQFAAFAAMDGVFHKTFRVSLLKYLASVAALFLLLVFINYILSSIF